MAKALFNVYETDEYHSTSSYVHRGTFTSKNGAIQAIVNNHDIPRSEFFELTGAESKTKLAKIDVEVRRLLRNELDLQYQTQGYSVNYVIEIIEQNSWQS